MEPLTYEELFDAVRVEKSREALQELPEDFYERATKYIEDKRKFVEIKLKDKSNFTKEEIDKEVRQLENVKRLVRDLYALRERKILALAIYYVKTHSNLIDKSALLPHEEELFNNIVNVLSTSRNSILDPIIEGKPAKTQQEQDQQQQEEEQEQDYTIKILDEIPKFLGPNNVVYGPFSKGDILDLPKQIAQILINKGKAIKIEEESELE